RHRFHNHGRRRPKLHAVLFVNCCGPANDRKSNKTSAQERACSSQNHRVSSQNHTQLRPQLRCTRQNLSKESEGPAYSICGRGRKLKLSDSPCDACFPSCC